MPVPDISISDSTHVLLKMYCGWKGYLVSVDQDEQQLDLYALRQLGASGKWTLNLELGEPLEATDEACIRACEVAVDERSGVRNLFLMSSQPQRQLASASGQKAIVYSLLMYSQSRRKLLNYGQSLRGSGNHESAIVAAEDVGGKVSILDGPIVVWTEGSQLQVMHSNSDHSHKMMQQEYNLENLISDHFCLVKVMDMWPFLSTNETINSFDVDCSSLFIVFLKLKVAAEATPPACGQSTVEWVCLQIKLRRSLQGLAIKLLQESELIPRDYGCISTCVTLHKSYSAGLSSGDIDCKYQFLVGTEYSQVVLLHKGVPLQCIALKYVPHQISLINSGTGLLSFACCSNSGETCAYQMDEDGPQACGEWKGIRHLVVGDFAHLGHDQLLLLFKDSVLDFLVTDLAQFNTTIKEGEEEERKTGQQCAESLVSVMNALNLQKYNGEAYLTGIKTELQLKSELLRKSLSFMKSLEQKSGEGEGERTHTSMSALQSVDPSLVCIIPGEIDVLGPTDLRNQAESIDQVLYEPPLKLMKLWQRLKNGLWLIGAIVQNRSSEVLKDLKFSIAPVKSQQTNPLDCSSRVVWIEQSYSNCSSKRSQSFSLSTGSPPAKRRKIEEPIHDLLQGLMEDRGKQSRDRLMLYSEMRLCVVLSTALPLMQSCGQQSLTIIATWKKTGESSCPGEEVSEIGVANLSHRLLCNGELNLNESCLTLWNGNALLPQDADWRGKGYQDLACILGMSSYILIEAHSGLTNLLSLPSMLRARLPLHSNAIITTEGQASSGKSADNAIRSNCGSCTLEALEGMVIYVTPNVNLAKIAVLFRSAHHLSLLLTSMRQCLPLDIGLQLITGTSWLTSLRGCLTSVLDEAKGTCKEVEHRMRGGDGCGEGSSQEEAKLRDKTDWTMSVATR